MKFFVLAILLVVGAAQAHRDWSKITPKGLHVMPIRPPPPPSDGSKIVNGWTAEPHERPFQLALIMNSGAFCGASLIRPNVVLTAAHCVDGARSVEAIAGAHYIQQEESSQQSIISSNIIIHEGWDRSTLQNDIALVILPKSFTVDGDTVQLIDLRRTSCPDSGLVKQESTISGWGRPSDSASGISPVLRIATNEVLANSVCNAYFGIIKDSHVCFAGTGRRGGCNGDSGGPMTVSTGSGVEQVGIASFVSGLGCESGFPTAYTRVSCFIDWIESKIN